MVIYGFVVQQRSYFHHILREYTRENDRQNKACNIGGFNFSGLFYPRERCGIAGEFWGALTPSAVGGVLVSSLFAPQPAKAMDSNMSIAISTSALRYPPLPRVIFACLPVFIKIFLLFIFSLEIYSRLCHTNV
jgi:hypothetical protein